MDSTPPKAGPRIMAIFQTEALKASNRGNSPAGTSWGSKACKAGVTKAREAPIMATQA